MKSLIVCSLIIGLAATTSGSAQTIITPICTDAASQDAPAISGNRIVWEDSRNGSWDIYMYDLLTQQETPICTTAALQMQPAIWGDKIVWQDYRNGNWDIYMYDLTTQTETPICTAANNQMNPAIYQDKIVWQDYRNGNWDIYMYNLTTQIETAVCTLSDIDPLKSDQTHPAVWGNTIVWEDARNGDPDIYMYTISSGTEKAVCVNPFYQQNPTISGNRILWQDNRNGNWDVYMRVLNYWTGSDPPEDLEDWPLTVIFDNDLDAPANQTYPRISGNNVAFQDDRNGASNIFIYSFQNELWGDLFSAGTDTSAQEIPAVSGDHVVWKDHRNGNSDIYMWSRPPGADLAVIVRADPNPVAVGDYATFTVTVYNHGPSDATGIIVTDTVCGHGDIFSTTSTGGVFSRIGHDLLWTIDTLRSGSNESLIIVVHTTCEESMCNKAWVHGNEMDYITENNYRCHGTRVRLYAPSSMGLGSQPSLAVDRHNKAHMSYLMPYDGGYHLYYKNNKAGFWSSRVMDISGNAGISDITIDSSGAVHLVYVLHNRNDDTDPYTLKYTNNTGGTWKTAETIYENTLGIWALSIGIDSKGKVHINFMAAGGMASSGGLIYMTDTSGVWTTDSLGMAYNHATMALDHNNRAHIGYYYFNQVLYLTNAPDGTWQPPEIVDIVGGQEEGMVLSIAVDAENHPHLSYVGGPEEDNRYAIRTVAGWQTAFIDSGGFQSSGNSIAIDSSGHTHILYHHIPLDWYTDPSNIKLKYASNATGAWISETVDPSGGPQNDIAADRRGNVHMCYANYTFGLSYVIKKGGQDSDMDGISELEEEGPNGNNPDYDGNGDGIPDHQQRNVASLHTYDDSQYVTLALQDSSLALANVNATGNPGSGEFGSPLPEACPYGFFSFTIFGLPAGGSAVLKLFLHGGPQIQTFYKHGPTPDSTRNHWYEFLYDGVVGAEISGDTITLHLTDGLRGDDDVTRNGVIVEPGAPIKLLTGVGEAIASIPRAFALWQNYPNPFNPTTTIRFALPKATVVTLNLYNMLGQEVATLLNERREAGIHEVRVNVSMFPSGVYFYRLHAGSFMETKKLILLK